MIPEWAMGFVRRHGVYIQRYADGTVRLICGFHQQAFADEEAARAWMAANSVPEWAVPCE